MIKPPTLSRRALLGDVAMTHIAIQEVRDGKVVDRMAHVTDEQCQGDQ